MVYPQSRLPLVVEIAPGAILRQDPGTWPWTDVTDSWRVRNGITIEDGRGDWGQRVDPGTISLTFDNRSGDFSEYNPAGRWYGLLGRDTPLRVRLRRGEDTFARSVANGWGAADSGQAWSHSGGPASDFTVGGGVGRHSHSTVNNLRATVLAVALVDLEQTYDVATPVALTGAALVTGVMARVSGDQQTYYWLRAELNIGGTVQLKVSRSVAGVLTELASLDPVPGLTYTPGVPLRVRASVHGTRLAIKAWPAADPEPSGWQLTAVDTAITAPGRAGIQTWLVGGNTNTLPVVATIGRYQLHVDLAGGYVPTWVPRWDQTSRDRWVTVTARGALARLKAGSGKPPKRSPMRRSIAAAPGTRAYWPCEDGTTSQQAASAIPGHPPATVTGGTPVFVPIEDVVLPNWTVRYGSSALVDLSTGVQVIADVPADVTTAVASWYTVSCVATGAELPLTTTTNVLMAWDTPGGTPYVRYEVQQVTDTSTFYERVVGVNAAGVRTVLISSPGYTANLDAFGVICRQVGGNITLDLRRVGGSLGIATFAGTLRGPSRVTLNPSGTTSVIPLPYGHLAVWAGAATHGGLGPIIDSYGTQVLPDVYAYPAETAHLRLARLAAEDGITIAMPAVAAGDVTRMGWQPVETSLPLYQQCEDADGGVIYERPLGLAYQPRTARYNQPAALTLDVAVGDLAATPEPDPDGQGYRNRWTVERIDGSSAVAEAAEVATGHVTVYDDQATVNLASDAGLPDQAGWRLHLTSQRDLRWPRLELDLAARPDLIDAWLCCRVGSRIRALHPPPDVASQNIDVLLEGHSATLGHLDWMIAANCSPAQPWTVAEADGEQRVAADGTTLAAPLSAGATSMSIISASANGPWTQDPANFPLDIRVGGEHVTASAISGTGLTQAVTISQRGANGVQRAWPAGIAVSTTPPAIAPL